MSRLDEIEKKIFTRLNNQMVLETFIAVNLSDLELRV